MVLFLFLLLACFLSITRHGVHAIKCYDCTSTVKNCGDPFRTEGVSTDYCRLSSTCLKFKYSAPVYGKPSVRRSCNVPLLSGNRCFEDTLYGAKGLVCYCNTDYCNHAPAVHPASVSWLIIISSAFYFSLTRIL